MLKRSRMRNATSFECVMSRNIFFFDSNDFWERWQGAMYILSDTCAMIPVRRSTRILLYFRWTLVGCLWPTRHCRPSMNLRWQPRYRCPPVGVHAQRWAPFYFDFPRHLDRRRISCSQEMVVALSEIEQMVDS